MLKIRSTFPLNFQGNGIMHQSIESLCNQLAKFRILSAGDIRDMRNRWLGESKADADNADKFSNWMVSQKYVSEFQSSLLKKGTPEQLFFAQYLLQDRIGQGRMAGVYKAVHQETEQQVAIKVLPPSKANNPQLLARFQREARMAIRIDHSNVVRTFEQGITKNGLNYIVMEFLDGEPLEDVIKRRKSVSVTEAIHVGVQALNGLQHLFEEGLVHRDVKPGNLMLVPGWKPGQDDSMMSSSVKLLDIGLGRAMFDEGISGLPENPDLTTEGSILGTPNYMAPEQARSAHTADIRADVYSLGCVLYEMLSGSPPFTDPNFMKQILRHATEAPKPLRELNPKVPVEVWRVIEVLLAKDPAQRFSTPAQASKALQATLPKEQELPKPPPPSPKMKSYLTWLATDNPAATAVAKENKASSPPSPQRSISPNPPMPKVPMPVGRSNEDAIPDAIVKQATATPLKPTTTPSPTATPKPPTPFNDPKQAVHKSPVSQKYDGRDRSNVPKAQPVAAGTVPLPKTPAPTTEGTATESANISNKNIVRRLPAYWKKLNVTSRDWIAAGIGAGTLLVLEGIIWFIIWVVGG